MNGKEDLKQRINPVFYTAQATLMSLCLAGVKDARLLAERLVIDIDSVMRGSEQEAVFGTAGNTVMEMRYRIMNNLIQTLGNGTILDLPCGYTPRAIDERFRDKRYIGCDLPAVTDALTPVMDVLLKERGISGKEYHSADATNYLSLRSALASVKGEICVVTEGLAMYLNPFELAELCRNIRRLLKEFGGCWLLYDPESIPLALATMRTVLGENGLATLRSLWSAYSDKSGMQSDFNVMMIYGSAYRRGVIGLKEFLGGFGLKAERVPVVLYLPKLNSLAELPDGINVELFKALAPLCVWKLTVDEDFREPDSEGRDEDFDMSLRSDDGVMQIRLRGRLDSLSAPKLLAAYEQAAEEEKPQKIVIDVSALAFLSSVGLRLFGTMAEQVGDGNLTVRGQSEAVQRILEWADLSEQIRLL